MTKILFVNQDAAQKEQIIHTMTREEAATVVDWYSAYYAGDDYSVEINDELVFLDGDGRAVATLSMQMQS